VYTKDTYIKGILVFQGPKDAFADCKEDDRPKGFTKPGDDDDDHGHGGYFPKCENKCIAWKKVDYAIVNGNMVGVPVGRHLMVIEAFDGCYNSSCMAFEFEVQDKIAPVMKCDDKLNISLSNGNGYTTGYAQATADDINEGSWDNCKLAWIAVRRNVPTGCEASFIGKGYDTNGNGKLDPIPADGDWTKADGFDNNGDGNSADYDGDGIDDDKDGEIEDRIMYSDTIFPSSKIYEMSFRLVPNCLRVSTMIYPNSFLNVNNGIVWMRSLGIDVDVFTLTKFSAGD
jgi:hypothetical protein